MSAQYFYLEISCGEELSRLSVRSGVEEAVKSVFGECGAASLRVDVLSAAAGVALLRVPAAQLRRVRAALLLHARPRFSSVCAAPALLALL